MILMIDNYDSFTYNLVQYLGELGATLRVVRNDECSVCELEALKPDGIVISPGPGRPEGAGVSLELIKAVAGSVPLLGVCLGHQALAQAYGARIGYAPTLMHGKTSEVSHNGGGIFEGIGSPFVATRYHSLVVDEETLDDTFTVTARTSDGVIMGIESEGRLQYGLQFHPESIMTPCGKALLKNFLKIVARSK